MLFSRWNGVVLIPVTAMVLGGGIFLGSQTNAQPEQDKDRPAKEASAVSKPVTPNPSSASSKVLAIPALRELKVAAGRGKTLVYAVDENGRRIPTIPVPSKRRRRLVGGRGDLLETPSKEVIVDLSWAVFTGVVDHRAIERSFSNNGELVSLAAESLYRGVELERQERALTGAWSDWQAVDRKPTFRILHNLPEVDEERTPEELRVDSLVDPLPFLKAGAWSGVDVERFVPKQNENNAGQRPVMVGGQMLGGRQRTKSRAAVLPELMSRQFDFSVEPGRTYRYRAWLVVGDARGRYKEVAGAWCEPTDPVTVASIASEDRSIRKVR